MLPRHPVSRKVADQGPGAAGHQCQDVPESPSYPLSTDTEHPEPEVFICTRGRLRRQAGGQKPWPAALPAPASSSRCGTKALGIRCPGHSQEATGAMDMHYRPYFHSLEARSLWYLARPIGPRIVLDNGRRPGRQKWADQLLPQGHQNRASTQPRWAGSGVVLWQQLSSTGWTQTTSLLL